MVAVAVSGGLDWAEAATTENSAKAAMNTGPRQRPTLDELRARLESRSETTLSVKPAEAVRAERDRQ